MLALAAAAGCATKPEPPPQPVVGSRLQMFFQRARDPRTFWLHVYDSPDGPVFVGAHRLHPNQVATLPIIARAGRGAVPAPVVLVRGQDETPYAALIDTGSKESWADFSAAVELGVVPLGPPAYTRKPTHVNDPAEGYLCALPTLRFDALRVETALLYAQTMDGPLDMLARAATPRPRLVAGSDLLGELRYFQVDYRQSVVTLSSTMPYRPSEQQLVATVPIELAHGVLAAKGSLDGIPQTFILDTAGDFEVAARDPLDPVAKQVTLGDLVVRDVPVDDAAGLGLGLADCPRIGRRLLARFRVTFDCKLKLAYFERPDRR